MITSVNANFSCVVYENLNFLPASKVSICFQIKKDFSVNLESIFWNFSNGGFFFNRIEVLPSRQGLFIITLVRRSLTFGYEDIAFQAKRLHYIQTQFILCSNIPA
jgi:hypothetical protein